MARLTIQQLREARGESQEELAQLLHAPATMVADWEMGRAEPSPSRLRALIAHYGIEKHQLNLRPTDPPTLMDRLENLF
jgi:DNA-binding transcriptional regulator YiaG